MSPHVRRPVLATVTLVAVYALSTTSATAAATPSTLPVSGGSSQALLGSGCQVVDFYIAYNPSMNKPRGHQDAPDHWSWASGC
jgi:hypothetical protein